jgi:ubiquinone/menaquinone biosynthesis C-methylase UbiE
MLASALSLPFKDNAFDLAITVQALHHMPSPEKAVEEMERVSKELCFFEPNKESAVHSILHWINSVKAEKLIGTDYDEAWLSIILLGFMETT